MILGEPDKPSIAEVLIHYGTKGMKWGVRKKKPTSDDIHAARVRQASRYRKFEKAQDDVNLATNSKSRNAAIRRRDKAEKEHDLNEDRVTAVRMTRGEKFGAVLVAGPLGLGIIAGGAIGARSVRRDVDKARAKEQS